MRSLKKQVKVQRPKKEMVRGAEASKRVTVFWKRKERLVAAIREGTR